MNVESISTENFRLLQTQTVSFSPNVNIIIGDNAQGKTTLLEAVYLLTGVKSFRSRYDKEMIAFDADEARISGRIFAMERNQTIELFLYKGKRRMIRQNGVKKTGTELNESLKSVLFSPEDLGLVRGPASGRRKLLDTAITQLRPGYDSLINDYSRINENKMRILKDWREKPDLLETLEDFSESMCRYSAKIIRYRASYVQKLNDAAGKIHREFSGDKENLSIRYETVSTVTDALASEKEIYEQVKERQCQLRNAELEAGQCLVGVHKDDLSFIINGTDAKTYASQGQVRTAALSVKLAERDIFLQDTGEVPVLLLDDVLSELDASRQEFVLNRIGGGQTLITCCEDGSISRMTGGEVLHMQKGLVT